MDKIITNKIYKKIFKKILTSDILGNISLEEGLVKKYIESPLFLNKLSSLVEKKDYSCKAVYSLGQDILVDIDKKHNPNNWLYQV